MAPGDVFRNAPVFFLCQAAHDSDEEFALGIERPDVFLFEINLDTLVLELAYRCQAVHGISGKAADRFRDDEVDFPFHGIPDHPLETIAIIVPPYTTAAINETMYVLRWKQYSEIRHEFCNSFWYPSFTKNQELALHMHIIALYLKGNDTPGIYCLL
jgi:hypothetical protein